ncbi:hypothetical protein OG871_07420 [Kitasatospora sp. NBC_00374]|uniref:hypothetical protein n=1 Tax=Kitasatospora sp. NBC_00374 TaxID=2975964 RepID=UPI0030DF7F53
MLPSGLDPERAALLNGLVTEIRSACAAGADQEDVQRLLAERGLGPVDAILVTRELLGGGPESLGQARSIVLESSARTREFEDHRRLMDLLHESCDEGGTRAG